MNDTSAISGTPDGYAAAFDTYHQHGWSVIPIPRAKKKEPPAGFTGHNGVIPSYADMMAWSEEQPDANTAIRLPPSAIGIDVDHYDGKRGGDTLAEAIERWGTLPYSPRSSSRPEDKVSGIRLYRIPEGVTLRDAIEFKSLELGGIEIIQFHHRYVLCWPSIHEGKTGNVYRWYGPNDEPLDGPPALDGLPDLPAQWLQALSEPEHETGDADSGYSVDPSDVLTKGEMSRRVSFKLGQALTEVFGQGRHDHVRDRVLGLLRCGKNGESGVAPALNALNQAFCNVAENTKREGGRREAKKEFLRFVYGTDEDAKRKRFGRNVLALLADTSYDDDETGSVATDQRIAGEEASAETGSAAARFKRPQVFKASALKPAAQPRWIAKRWVPRAAPTVFCGDEGIGKTLWDIRLIAAVSTGTPLPDIGVPKRDPQPVLLAAITEEDWSSIVLPRLEVAGADLDMIDVICTETDGSGPPIFPRDFDLIRDLSPKPALIVVDSWLDTLAMDMVVRDSQSAARSLAPWTDLGTTTDAGIILLTPTNRLGTGDIREKYGATQHLRKKARMTVFGVRDDDTDLLVVGPDKANTTRPEMAAMYRIDAIQHWEPTEDDDGTVGKLKYVAVSDRSIREWVTDKHDHDSDADETQLSAAMKWLHDYLLPRLDAPTRLSDEVKAAAKKEKITDRTLRRARQRLHVVIDPVKGSVPFTTYWRLP